MWSSAPEVAKPLTWRRRLGLNVGAHIVSLPTIASNDAPTSGCTVYYTDDGVLDGYDIWPRNPDMVLVDLDVIANAPARWMVSGIGDALATWFEADAAFKGRRPAFAGGMPTMTAMTLARLCYDVLMEYGLDAVRDVENHVVTPALEKVVEATTLLSGIGLGERRLGMRPHDWQRHYHPGVYAPVLHGEKVAFGLMTQLCLDDDVAPDERNAVVDFMIEIGLPVTFAEIGMDKVSREELMDVAVKLTAEGNFIHNHVFPVKAYALLQRNDCSGCFGKKPQSAVDNENLNLEEKMVDLSLHK